MHKALSLVPNMRVHTRTQMGWEVLGKVERIERGTEITWNSQRPVFQRIHQELATVI